MNPRLGSLFIILSGCLWGTLGLFGKVLFQFGLEPKQVVFCRLAMGFLIMLIIVAVKDKGLLKINRNGLKYTALIGLVTQAIFNTLYFQTIKRTSITTAVVLLYTAPVFLVILGRMFYKEPVTRTRLAGLLVCILGSFLAVTGGTISVLKADFFGILSGLGAGFAYALATILGKALLEAYHPLTVVLYSFGFGVLFLVPVSDPVALLHISNGNPSLVLVLIGFGLIPASLAYICYFTGLSLGVEASIAGVISSIEIVVSVIFAKMVFHEVLNLWKIAGILLILLSICMGYRRTCFAIKPEEHKKIA